MKLEIGLLVAIIIVYYLLIRQIQSKKQTLNTNTAKIVAHDVYKKDCSKCAWKLKDECTIHEGNCYIENKLFPELKDSKEKCESKGYTFVPTGVVRKSDVAHCTDVYAHACLDSSNTVCDNATCTTDTWIPEGCNPYKEVGVCLSDDFYNNKPEKCMGEFVVNGIVKSKI